MRQPFERAGFHIAARSMHDYRPTLRAWFDNLVANKEQALKILAEAIDAGFDQLEVLEGDDDFKSVRDEKKFKEIVEKLREKKKIRT